MVKWQGMRQEPEKEVVVVESGEGVISRRATLFLSSVSFLLSIMFLSQNITGNVVANFSTNGANWLGGILFVLAIIGFLVYVQKSKKKKKKKQRR